MKKNIAAVITWELDGIEYTEPPRAFNDDIIWVFKTVILGMDKAMLNLSALEKLSKAEAVKEEREYRHKLLNEKPGQETGLKKEE